MYAHLDTELVPAAGIDIVYENQTRHSTIPVHGDIYTSDDFSLADQALLRAGWDRVSDWEPTSTGYVASVEKLRH